MEHQDYQDLLAAHSLDALDVSAARVLEEHLNTCAECQVQLVELRDVGSLLAYSVAPAEPGLGVRAHILSAVRAEGKRDQPGVETPALVVPFEPRAKRNAWTIGLRLAAGIAFIALLVGAIVLWRREVKMRQELAQLSQQFNTQQQELVRDRELLARQREVLALLNSPTAKVMALGGTQTATNARATFVFDQKTGHGMLMAEGLPATAGDKAYELWFIPKGQSPVPGKVFTVDASGRAMMSQQIPAEAMENAVIAITLEPRKGSAAPTGAMYLVTPSS